MQHSQGESNSLGLSKRSHYHFGLAFSVLTTFTTQPNLHNINRNKFNRKIVCCCSTIHSSRGSNPSEINVRYKPRSQLEKTDLDLVCGWVKGKDNKQCRTPESKRVCSPRAVFSPASFSPVVNSVSAKYKSRTNSGEVVFPYKNESFTSTLNNSDRAVRMELLTKVDIERYMNFDLVDALDYADDLIDKLGNILAEKFHLEDIMSVCYKHPTPFVTYGRIACDSDGRLNAKSVILEGSRDLSLGESIPLDLGGVEKYSVFPGQVVAVEGVNITGEKLVAKNIYYDASSASQLSSQPRGPLSFVVATGPYTHSDSMSYQPLLDLVERVASDEPDLFILTGPFIDSTHSVVLENSLAETFDQLFKKIVDIIMSRLNCKKTQVLMLSSYKDCNAKCVYPTPPLQLPERVYKNLHFLPDPSIVSVDGVVIGITSTDTLMHIGKEEISSSGYGADRLSRLAGHIISQRNFYPLLPAAGVPVDPSMMEFAQLNIKPDILILPSDLRYFIKDVLGCVVVNPERLAKGVIGGTYARMDLTSSGLTGSVIRI